MSRECPLKGRLLFMCAVMHSKRKFFAIRALEPEPDLRVGFAHPYEEGGLVM
jgi:hypothetical protein